MHRSQLARSISTVVGPNDAFAVAIVQSIGPIVLTSTYSDYRPVKWTADPLFGRVGNQRWKLDLRYQRYLGCGGNPPDLDAHLKKPASNVHDFSIVGGGTQTSVPFYWLTTMCMCRCC